VLGEDRLHIQVEYFVARVKRRIQRFSRDTPLNKSLYGFSHVFKPLPVGMPFACRNKTVPQSSEIFFEIAT
jgi:hypothetical protein